MSDRPKTLYVTRNGLLEPLGQSQALAYIKGLSAEYQVTLLSYEKPQDAADAKAMQRIQDICDEHGIGWQPQIFRSKPKYIASAFSILRLFWLVLRAVRRGEAQLIHARSYIPAAAALFVYHLTGKAFIFDMRALWPEELITANRLRRGSGLHKAIVWIERSCLRHAATVITLTYTSVDFLRQAYPDELEGQTIKVIPTCADLERFTPGPKAEHDGLVHGCFGSITSGWFLADWVAEWFAQAAVQNEEDRFEIITRDDPERVRALVDAKGFLGKRLQIASRSPEDMPEAIRVHDLSIMVYAGGVPSELGRSPTRLAEALGCGRPVVVNKGVGDVAQIVSKHQVGVIIEGNHPEQIACAIEQLKALLLDPDLAQRCRATAKSLFSLGAGVQAYRGIYETILSEGITK